LVAEIRFHITTCVNTVLRYVFERVLITRTVVFIAALMNVL